MRRCPKCNSWRVQTLEQVVKSFHCHACGWIDISDIKLRAQSFPRRQYLHALFRSAWVYVVFSVVILVGGYLVSTEVITPAKYFALQDVASLFSEKSETAGEIKAESVTTEAPVVLVPTARAVPDLPGVSVAGAERVSFSQPEKVRIVANSKSKRYHLPGMKYYEKIPKNRRVIFTSEEAAQRAGYIKSSR